MPKPFTVTNKLRARGRATIVVLTTVALTTVGGLQATRSWGATPTALLLPAAPNGRQDDLVRERALRASLQRAADAKRAAASKKQAAARKAAAAKAAEDRMVAKAYAEAYAEAYTEATKAAALRLARATAATGASALPVAGARVTATFGQIGHLWLTFHTGVDLAVPEGTPVVAAAAGTVVSAADDGPYGLRIKVLLPDGTETRYGHLSSFVVRSGQVQAGQLIGLSGNTGSSSGPHLHFEVRVHGAPIDPQLWLRARGVDI